MGNVGKSAFKPTLKRLCPTRWVSRHDALHALRFRYADILKALTKIALQSKKSEECTEATGLIKSMETFEFAMMLVIQENVLERVNVVSHVLQKKDVDLIQAATLLENTCIKSTAQKHSTRPCCILGHQLSFHSKTRTACEALCPVTVASIERSFSKLKLIKTCMRSTMNQDKLSKLAILSIESQRARQMDITDIMRGVLGTFKGNMLYCIPSQDSMNQVTFYR